MIAVFWVWDDEGERESGRVSLDERGLQYPDHLASLLGTLVQKVDPTFDLWHRFDYDYHTIDVGLMERALQLAPWVFSGSRMQANLYAREEDIPDKPMPLPDEPPAELHWPTSERTE
jgi:hypothetical protein